MNSFADLKPCQARHLADYLDPDGPRAFWAYDGDWDPDHFRPVDALAPGLLDAPVKGSIVVEMFKTSPSPYTALRASMQHLLDATSVSDPRFTEIDLGDDEGPWGLVRTVLRLSDATPGLAASMVTKMLHRKRPQLVPIFDSKVAAFYGTTSRTPWNLWPSLQADLRNSSHELRELISGVATPDGRNLSALRALDIVVWEHMVTNCHARQPSRD